MALFPLMLWSLLLACWTLTPGSAGEDSLSLLKGDTHCEGVLHVEHRGQQGLVCGDRWGMQEALVVCRHLKCRRALYTPQHVLMPQDMKPPWLYGAQCQGEEGSLWKCSLGDWGPITACNCQCVVVVMCSGGFLGHIRLGGGVSPCAGTPELVHPGKTTLRCDLQKKEADVICRDLQCGNALQWSRAHPQGRLHGQEQRFLTCQGTEPSLFQCKANLNFLESCDLPVYTDVVCTGHVEARLAGSEDPCAGRLEVRRGLTWGTVCSADLDLPTAHVVCRELQCGMAISTLGNAHFGQGLGPVWMEAFRCVGNESLLFHCPREPGSQCTHQQDAGLRCSGEKFRLVNGSSPCEGRVELQVQGTWLDGVWGRVLDDAWDLRGASVVCRQLGCGEAQRAYDTTAPNRGAVPVGLSQVRCKGSEARLTQCNVSVSQLVPAGSLRDVGVMCSGSLQVRLAGGPGRCAGRVEVLQGGSWGTVCDDAWDLQDAHVVCGQLGCGHALSAPGGSYFGSGSGPIWMDELGCLGNESALWQCPSPGWGQHDCGHKEDAGVFCSELMDVRLQKYGQPCAGRLEVFYNGTWGGVCHFLSAASLGILCGQLGCGSQGQLLARPESWSSPEIFWLTSIQCRPRHDKFQWQCPSAPWDQHSCSSSEEAWVLCAGDDSWDLADAEVVCRQLGCGQAMDAVQGAAFGPGSGPVWLDEVGCRGSEAFLLGCPAQPLGYGDCEHKEDAGVHCSGIPAFLFVTGAPFLAPAPVAEAWTLPEIACLVLGCLLGLIFLFLGVQRNCHRDTCLSPGMSECLPSEGIYEDIEALPVEEKEERNSVSGNLVLEEYYDDAEEPGEDCGEETDVVEESGL
ncbi:PREDICTED: scavenger receptor cysteine-rich type 1 protein M130-like [Chinchilla lanigera]|uniref:scavenger receptor cysteine-rich type 1 protein M130-like n=1 Tax=Chinchilla lanigera TaxID=34839 RepID=UPI00069859DD|nr:PREDICTED: scavenger receptor cysteine-rich type 1 protein M130-like [Chinchilla lanigera]